MSLKDSFFSRGISTAKLTARLGLGATKRYLNLKPMETDQAVELAHKLVEEFDGMKGLVMKFGQMASYLGGNLPPEARAVLAQLQASSTAMPFADVRACIESELGHPVETLFDEFEERAFAAASIGQVHRAKLKGEFVAVKVQYPGIESLIDKDLAIIGKLFVGMMAGTKMPGRAMIEELKARITEECDYRQEARHQTTVRDLCAHHPGQYVPKVISSHSSKRVLTSEYIDAEDFQSFKQSATQEQKNRAGLIIFEHSMNAIFRYAYFNGDPHPGNYLFDDQGRVIFLDFGCLKKFDPDYIELWKALAMSVLDQDKAANLAATRAMGFIGNEKKFDHDFHWQTMNHIYQPYMATEGFRYCAEHNKKTNEYLLWNNRNRFSTRMPPDILLINRLQWGLAAVLADLDAENVYHTAFRDAVEAELRPAFADTKQVFA